MLTKFESKSNRVKGLAFHVSRPWILTSLHNGVIQLWDYRMGTLLDRFDEHDGPVRGVDFHKTQPLFASGGDDYKLKVWDFKLRRCLFTLLGHLDYIRTVQFHHEYPWILSCSDDQTIRIWNWQSRSCVSILTGHNHYVMCAAFHPKDDLIVSASLDQTVRVWDTTGLRKKTVRGAPSSMDDVAPVRANNHDIFGASDAIVKYVLEGHDRGVNWANFHPNLPLIVSGADDRQVKLWRMNETKAWEVDTMRGHTNNVSCVIFHPRHELIISNSEDRSIRVWDISKRMGLQTFRRENDRFWVLQAHPTQNLLAAGHDSGMIVFKLERERPAMDIHEGRAYYVKERYVRMYSFLDGSDVPVAAIRRTGTAGTGMGNLPRALNYNPYDPTSSTTSSILMTTDAEGGSYELVTFGQGSNGETSDSSRGPGLFAVFVARNRFAVLDKSRHIVIKNFQNEVTKKITPPNGTADGLYFGGIVGRVLLHIDDKMVLYETQSRRVLADVQAPRVKYVVWSPNYEYVAMISKHSIVLADKQLNHLSTITESVRIKSGIWANSPEEIFVYTTLNHIKYSLTNGDSGIIRTLDVPVYLTHLEGSKLYCLDREAKMRTMAVDLTECEFKIALSKKNYTEVMRMVRHSRLCGQAIISYLTKKGYPEVALHFVNDEKTRFKLAISCGNLEVALNSAYELDDSKCWHQLGVEALRQGNIQVVEMAYQRTKNFERLSFLYLVTGNRDKLKKMLKIAEVRNDIMSRFHNALFLGDVEVRVLTLESAGQFGLALLTAATHGLDEHVERLKAILAESNPTFDADAFLARETRANAALLSPPPCVSQIENENWPQVQINEPTIQDHAIAAEKREAERSAQRQDAGSARRPAEERPAARKASMDLTLDAGDAWGDDGDLDLDDSLSLGRPSLDDALDTDFGGFNADSSFVAAPSPGTSFAVQWVRNSSLAADHAAAGSLATAMQLLHRQIGVVNFEPLKPVFMQVYSGAAGSVPTQPNYPPLRAWLQRNESSQPAVAISFPQLVETLKEAYRAFTGAKFDEVKSNCESILYSIPFLAVASKEEAEKVKSLLTVCREYLLACRVRSEVAKFPLETDPKRNVELSAYFTHCELQPPHLVLTLKIAMTNAFKSNNFITAASFCRRLLEIPEVATHPRHEKLRLTARKVLQKAEKEARNEHQLDYQDSKPFVLCARSFSPLYLGERDVRCPYCSSAYHPEFKGSLCDVCCISRVGEETIGLVRCVRCVRCFCSNSSHPQTSPATERVQDHHETVAPVGHKGTRNVILEFRFEIRTLGGRRTREAMLVLQCRVEGRSSSSFVVTVDENASVLKLMETILQNHRYSMPCSAAELTLFRSTQAPSSNVNNGTSSRDDGIEMDRTKSLAEYFPPRPSFQQEELYRVLIALPARLIPKTTAEHDADGYDNDGVPATKKRKMSELEDFSTQPTVSESETEIPVTLLCAAFGVFEDNCKHGSLVELTKKDCELVFFLCHAMAEDYTSGKEREKRAKDLFGDYFLSDHPTVAEQSQPESDSSAPLTRELLPFEVKVRNERKICSVGEYLKDLSNEVSNTVPLPYFLLEISGPFLRVYGAVHTGKNVYCEPLVPTVPLVWVDKLSLMESVARMCASLKIAVHELHAAQSKAHSTNKQSEMEFPYKDTAMINGELVNIQYEERLQGLVFVGAAIELGECEVVVKFAKLRYGREVHEHCAAIGFAPKLLAYEHLPGGWHFCVMEMIENATPIWEVERSLVESKLREIPKLLRAANFVHGDLRIYNILWDTDAQQLKLVDFDWAGRQGATKYPPFLCPEVPWPKGVETNSVIEFAHDVFWINEFLDA